MSWQEVMEDRNRRLNEILLSCIGYPGRNDPAEKERTFVGRTPVESLRMRSFIGYFIALCGGVDFVDIRDVEKFVRHMAGLFSAEPEGLKFRHDIVKNILRRYIEKGNDQTVSDVE